MTALTSAIIAKLNKMNKAAQLATLGTKLALLDNVVDAGSLGAIVKIAQTVAFGDFTDGGGAVGTLELDDDIPAGATFLIGHLLAVTGFAGNTSAALTVGDGTTADRYNTSTINVFADIAGGVGLGAPSGVQYHAAAKTPTLTITVNSDWGLVTAGGFTIELFYLT